MEKYLPFVNNRIDDLVKITISERKQKGIGVLFLDFCEKEKFDCRYVGLSEEHFPQIVRERYAERMQKVPNSIIFFLIYDETNELLYEVDLDNNSNYHQIEQNNLNAITDNSEIADNSEVAENE